MKWWGERGTIKQEFCSSKKKQVKHTKGIFLLSGITYPNIADHNKQSHKAGYQLAKLAWGLTYKFTGKGRGLRIWSIKNGYFMDHMIVLQNKNDPYRGHL